MESDETEVDVELVDEDADEPEYVSCSHGEAFWRDGVFWLVAGLLVVTGGTAFGILHAIEARGHDDRDKRVAEVEACAGLEDPAARVLCVTD